MKTLSLIFLGTLVIGLLCLGLFTGDLVYVTSGLGPEIHAFWWLVIIWIIVRKWK